jgi:hypothetical protein
LAMNNSSKDDDIDLMIITSSNRLWLTRLIITLWLDLLGKRRRPGNIKYKILNIKYKKYKNKICLNMWLDETVLKLNKNKQNLFTAHELVQMKLIFNRDYTYEKFLSSNEWVRKYLPNGIDIKILTRLRQGYGGQGYKDIKGIKVKNIQQFLNFSISQFLDILEKVAFQIQYNFMKSKITREEVTLHFAFFHPIDRAKEILRNFEKV